MDMITTAEVIRRVARSRRNPAYEAAPNLLTIRPDLAQAIQKIPPRPEHFCDRGIVICGGGVRYFTCAWVAIQRLRRLGCTLPIQLWHLGPGELDATIAALLASLGVTCIDALEVRKEHPARILNGWELKSYAILHSTFQETGAIFWPDFGRLAPDRDIWEVTGVPYRDEPEFESEQIVVDKKKCWRPLWHCMWYNEYSDFFTTTSTVTSKPFTSPGGSSASLTPCPPIPFIRSTASCASMTSRTAGFSSIATWTSGNSPGATW